MLFEKPILNTQNIISSPRDDYQRYIENEGFENSKGKYINYYMLTIPPLLIFLNQITYFCIIPHNPDIY
jgi:hypothetical protein